MKFILASKSPRRKELLSNIGLKFDVLESDVDESVVSKELSPAIYVQELAMLKSSFVASKCGKGRYVIGADTVVELNGEILGKPKDYDDAFRMLKAMSGRAHRVYTGIAVSDSSDMKTVTAYSVTEVFFSELSDEEISNYITTYQPYDKAGAYGIQEYAGVFVEKIEGDFFNVVGLPVASLYGLLKKEFGVII